MHESMAESGDEGGADIHPYIQRTEEADILKGTGHAEVINPMGGESRDGPAFEKDFSLGRSIDAGEDIKEGSFTCAIGADQTDEFPFLNPQGDISEGGESAKAQRAVFGLKQGSLAHDAVGAFLAKGLNRRR
jgi:hypothetical protein